MSLDTYTKQPADVQDYDISFAAYLAALSDTQAALNPVAVTVDAGIDLLSHTCVAGVVKVWLSGGSAGASYKVTATLTTTGARVKQHEIIVAVAET